MNNGQNLRRALIWAALTIAMLVPITVAASSPLLAWREPIYIAGGIAGIAAMTLLLVQPLLGRGYLPELSPRQSRHLHQVNGALLVLLVTLHVAGLWLTSPPDVIDALTFSSPTPFSNWGVIAMWALFVSALLAIFRRRWRHRPHLWRISHAILAVVIVIATVVHAMLIEGTMGTMSKTVLGVLIVAAMGGVVVGILRQNIGRR